MLTWTLLLTLGGTWLLAMQRYTPDWNRFRLARVRLSPVWVATWSVDM